MNRTFFPQELGNRLDGGNGENNRDSSTETMQKQLEKSVSNSDDDPTLR